jgi:hypothetical protein
MVFYGSYAARMRNPTAEDIEFRDTMEQMVRVGWARVLPLLSTHLSLREIGERLYISPHTVKPHTASRTDMPPSTDRLLCAGSLRPRS